MTADDHITYDQRRCVNRISDHVVQLNQAIDCYLGMVETGVNQASKGLLELAYVDGSDVIWQQLRRLNHLDVVVSSMLAIDVTLLYGSAVEAVRLAHLASASQVVMAKQLGAIDNNLQSLNNLTVIAINTVNRIEEALSNLDGNSSSPVRYLQYIRAGINSIITYLSRIQDDLSKFYKSVAINL